MFTKIAGALALVVFLTGCATNQQKPVSYSGEAQNFKNQKIGIAVAQLPKVEMQYPGAGCLLCLMAASATNSGLSKYTESLPRDDILNVRNDLAKKLSASGAEVVVIEEELAVKTLPDAKSKGENIAAKDFSSIQQRYKLDKLLVIEVQVLGISRAYSAYIPAGDPQSLILGKAYMVNLATNGYEWYQPIQAIKGSDGKWDEPPNYPGLTNAYFQAIELAKEDLVKQFSQ